MNILTAFLSRYKEEGLLLGRILAGYSELEISLMMTVHQVRSDFDAVMKTMFRTRGETQRIEIADALARNLYADGGLSTQFSMAIGNMKFCLQVRNQYAHCAWNEDQMKQTLAFSDLEDIAADDARVTGLENLVRYPIDVPLLQAQLNYFAYVDDCFWWLSGEMQVRKGIKKKNRFGVPKQLVRPPMHNS